MMLYVERYLFHLYSKGSKILFTNIEVFRKRKTNRLMTLFTSKIRPRLSIIRNYFSKRESLNQTQKSHKVVTLFEGFNETYPYPGEHPIQRISEDDPRHKPRLASSESWRIFHSQDRLQLALATSPDHYLPITPWREAFSAGVARIARRRKPQQWTRQKFRLVCDNRFQTRSPDLSRGCFPRTTLCHEQFPQAYSTWLHVV